MDGRDGYQRPQNTAARRGGGPSAAGASSQQDESRPASRPDRRAEANNHVNSGRQQSLREDASHANRNRTSNPGSRTILSRHAVPGIIDSASDEFGIIISIRDAFGFLQPLSKEEQLYFSLRDIKSQIGLGDLVRYQEKANPRGPTAEHIRLVTKEDQVVLPGVVTGTVAKEPDANRRMPGTVNVTSHSIHDANGNKFPLPSHIPFIQGAAETYLTSRCCIPSSSSTTAAASSSSGSSKGLKRIIKGDEVEFDCVHVANSCYFLGKDVKVTRTKKELQFAIQIQRMLDAGAVMESGIIESIKGEYGFLKPQDRKDPIYFRLSDMIDQDIAVEIGLEVSFFVIMESIKGSMSERAVHLQILPKGTVQFEATLAQAAGGIVVAEPVKAASSEKPGSIRLFFPVSTTVNHVHKQTQVIELWARCIPDALTLRVGDVVVVDVRHYRPENLIFARNLRVQSYRQLGREFGVIKSLRGVGYGFLSSSIRDFDMYFKTGEVLGVTGEVLKERDLSEGMAVSFDVIVDESTVNNKSVSPSLALGAASSSSSSSGMKLRACRVIVVADLKKLSPSHPIKVDVEGVIQRDAKKDTIGIIKLLGNIDDANMLEASCPPEMVAALAEFDSLAELNSVVIEMLPSSQRKCFYRVLDCKFPHLCHEAIDSSVARDNSKLLSIRIWKPQSVEEHAEWQSKRTKQSNSSTTAGEDNNNSNSYSNAQKKISIVHFLRADVMSEFIVKDMEVVFDIHLDSKSGNFVAKAIRLTEKPFVATNMIPMPMTTDRFCGVIQMLSTKGTTKYGFIRSIPTSQKIFWHESSVSSVASPSVVSLVDVLQEGMEVSFQLRLRGGLPCAVGLQPLPLGAFHKEVLVAGDCIAVVVEEGKAVLIDASASEFMRYHYWDGQHSDQVNNGSSNGLWKHFVLPSSDGSTVVGEGGGADEAIAKAPVVDETSEITDKRAPKYWDLLQRVPVDIRLLPTQQLADLHVGEVIRCNCLVNWALSAQPIAFVNVRKVSVATNDSNVMCVRKSKGVVVRLPIKRKAYSYERSAHNSIDLCEIKETARGPTLWASEGQSDVAIASNALFCDLREIQKEIKAFDRTTATVPSIALNDPIEYFSVAMSNGVIFAIAAVVPVAPLAAAAADLGINFKRNINLTLKEAHSKQGYKGVVMAKGPPDEVNVGFTDGWRQHPVIHSLPWAHLLVDELASR